MRLFSILLIVSLFGCDGDSKQKNPTPIVTPKRMVTPVPVLNLDSLVLRLPREDSCEKVFSYQESTLKYVEAYGKENEVKVHFKPGLMCSLSDEKLVSVYLDVQEVVGTTFTLNIMQNAEGKWDMATPMFYPTPCYEVLKDSMGLEQLHNYCAALSVHLRDIVVAALR